MADALQKATVDVGGVPVCPYDVEHGVLRRDSARASSFLSGLVVGRDATCGLPLAPPPLVDGRPDPRVGLALHAGIAACGPPAVPIYAAGRLDAQLDATAARVCAHFFDAGPDDATCLPPVVRFFGDDFAPRGSSDKARLADAVARFLPARARADFAARTRRRAPVKIAPFDCAPARLARLPDDDEDALARLARTRASLDDAAESTDDDDASEPSSP